MDSEALYEWVLRFKALASLAGRERNRMIQKNTVRPELLERIRKAQNAVAALESENMIRDAEKDYEKQLEDLRSMENEFAACFPENTDFMNISLETVQNAIPDDTAVVEYFLTADQYGQMQVEDRRRIWLYLISTLQRKNQADAVCTEEPFQEVWKFRRMQETLF